LHNKPEDFFILYLLKKSQFFKENYLKSRYSPPGNILLVPAGNRTLASYRGVDVYFFDREGGMSWAAPYIAGLAALAFQVKPEINPATIKALLIKKASQTAQGPVINPVGFIDNVRAE